MTSSEGVLESMHPMSPTLRGLRVALSLSAPTDLADREQTEAEMGAAAAAIVQAIAGAGGTIVYCPRLPMDGLSEQVVEEALRYGVTPTSLRLVVPQIEYAYHSLRYLQTLESRLQPRGVLELVTSAGRTLGLDVLDTGRVDVPDAEALTALRKTIAEGSDARVAIGGRVPLGREDEAGVVEECRLTLDAGGRVLPVGSFGGAAELVARVAYADAYDGHATSLPRSPIDRLMQSQRSLRAQHPTIPAEIQLALASSSDPVILAAAVVSGLRAQ